MKKVQHLQQQNLTYFSTSFAIFVTYMYVIGVTKPKIATKYVVFSFLIAK